LQEGVTLAAAVAAQRARIGYGLPDQEWRAHQQQIASARATLEERQFERAWTHGDRLTIAEAIALAGEIEFAETAPTPVPAAPGTGELAILTPRELEVLRLIVEGKTDREIARELSISSGTASRHVANILHKIEVRTRSAAAAWYIRNTGS
jgi:DNA-binding NarL/FixJ family response regulator